MSALKGSYELVRMRFTPQGVPKSKPTGSVKIGKKENTTASGYCNGTGGLPGCVKDPIPVGEFTAVYGTGHYWCQPCADKYGLKPGMVPIMGDGVWQSTTLWVNPADVESAAANLKTKTPLPALLENKAHNQHQLDAIRSQKALGVGMLARAGKLTPPTILLQGTADLRSIDKVLKIFKEGTGQPTWARPCPTRPRHGFLESRAVETVKEVGKLWRDTVRIEPDAELMLQPMVDAGRSAILTPNQVVWGPGNDGATSGKDCVSLKLGPTPYELMEQGWVTRARITGTDVPYYEIVYEKGHLTTPVFVQMRGGPYVAAVRDYVPRKGKVKHLYLLDPKVQEVTPEALLEWEAAVPRFKPGTVVVHFGGSVSSHYGVHCVTNGIPYFTTRVPEVGEVIEPIEEDEQLVPDMVRQGLLKGWGPQAQRSTQYFNRSVQYAMFALHNYTADRSEIGSEMLGHAATRLFKLMGMACLGEFRHFEQTHGDRRHTIYKLDPELTVTMMNQPMNTGARETIFTRVWQYDLDKTAKFLTVATRSFLRDQWSSGMGGLMWGQCGVSALHLYNALQHVRERPSPRALKYLVDRMNSTVNLVHNGGSLFNKFCDTGTANMASHLSRTAVLETVLPILTTMRADTTPTPKVSPTPWKRGVPATLREYGKRPEAIKRCFYETGSADDYFAAIAANQLGNTLIRVWNAHQTAIGKSLWATFTPISKLKTECTHCGRLRAIYRSQAEGPISPDELCYQDCDTNQRQHDYDKYNRYMYVKQMLHLQERAINPALHKGSRVVDINYTTEVKQGTPTFYSFHVDEPDEKTKVGG